MPGTPEVATPGSAPVCCRSMPISHTGTIGQALATLVVAGTVLVGVGGTATVAEAKKQPKLSGSITVAEAASDTEAFADMKVKFEKQNPGTTINLNPAASSALVTQILGGAPADVFASADLANMDKLVTAGKVKASPQIYARNQIEIAVKPGNPKGVKSVTDLPNVGIVSLCGATVPCGVYAANVLQHASVTIPESSITRGADAKTTIAAVAQGDAQAAMVYVTDVLAAGKTVTGVEIPEDQNTIAIYPIAPIAGTSNPRLANAWISYVLSPAGQKILAKHGFLPPNPLAPSS
jgi:molybdate transport system substrate-binding protein